MCGIAGIIARRSGRAPEAGELGAMLASLHHRGPENRGSFVSGRVAMGQCRLAIIDLKTGRQPIHNEDGNVCVVCNGEIYNYRELRERLRGHGHQFSTGSDTEVIAHLWEEEGVELVHRLNGMFAIAIHDQSRGEVALMRDHLGIKPLFYAETDDALVFGSEVKALLASGRVERELDVDGLGQFLAWEHIAGAQTLLKQVRKLEPAHYLLWRMDADRGKVREYWDLPLPAAGESSNGSAEQWAEAVDEQLHRSVRQQMVSDVPLGAFLSGGVDSSLIVAAMGDRARSFSIGFDDPSYNELPWAQRVAEAIGAAHVTDVVRSEMAEMFDRLMPYMDDPIADFSIFPTYLVSRHAKRHVTVALSGDGGDELFGGYETYMAQRIADKWERVPRLARAVVEPWLRRLPPTRKKKGLINKAQRFAEGLAEPASLGHARWRVFVGEIRRQSLFTEAAQRELTSPVDATIRRYTERAAHCDPVTRALYVDAKTYLPDNCLVKMDRMAMAHSLEARVPLLDKEMASLAFEVPADLKLNGSKTKPLLKQVARRHVPAECVDRPKEGFSIPIKHWLQGPMRPRMEALLDEGHLKEEGLFDAKVVERMKREHVSGKANHSHVLWSLMVFEDWRQRWHV